MRDAHPHPAKAAERDSHLSVAADPHPADDDVTVVPHAPTNPIAVGGVGGAVIGIAVIAIPVIRIIVIVRIGERPESQACGYGAVVGITPTVIAPIVRIAPPVIAAVIRVSPSKSAAVIRVSPSVAGSDAWADGPDTAGKISKARSDSRRSEAP
jgi:hypothetical protein